MSERNLDFDKVIDRRNTRCLKYDFAKRCGMPEDVLPLWVADMDFVTTSYIEDALIERARHGIFGYSEVQTPYFEILANWLKKHHNWDIQEKWLIKTPGVVFALAMAVKAYTEIGESEIVRDVLNEYANNNHILVVSKHDSLLAAQAGKNFILVIESIYGLQ